MALPDAAQLTPAQREKAGLRVKRLRDIIDFPDLAWFNSEPCPRHKADGKPYPLCQSCGIIPRRHQRIGAAWMYLAGKGLLSDTVGSGKTAQALLVLAMCKQNGELGYHNRAVIICKPAAMHDPWADSLRRLTPDLHVIVADGTPAQRKKLYEGDWEVAVVSERTFAPAKGATHSRPGDVDILAAPYRQVGILFYDDTDAMRNPSSRTCRAINRLAKRCTRVHGMHATPLQKRLMELWSFLGPVGGHEKERLGSESRCHQRYVTTTSKWITMPSRGDKTGRQVTRQRIFVDSGMTRDRERVLEFRRAIAPIVLRRTAADLDDVDLPDVQLNPVFLDLHPAQRRRYEELRSGVLRRLTADGQQVTRAVAAAAFTRGQQICGGLAALDEGPGTDISVKLDWVMDALTGDLSDEKVVCFVYHRGNVRALSERLKREKIGHVIMSSDMTDKRRRARRLQLFRDDPRARVLIGTTTIEASLNLQTARHLIAVDTILNPARMEQLVGRVRRQGSAFGMVFLHQLLCRGTQEDGYLPLLRREAEVAGAVWDEATDIFRALTPRQIMRMITEGRPGSAAA